MPLLSQIILGAVLAAAIAVAAYRARALTRSGAWAAWGVGTVVFGIGGWTAAGALLAFFVSSSALSRWRKKRKEILGYEKGSQRDIWQVLANGGVAAACLLLTMLGLKNGTLLFLAALAAANADTWATEVGSALGGQPRDIRSGRKAPAGTSGAVSLPGTTAALLGAALLGAFAGGWALAGVVTVSGFGGALADSLLGATVQAQWRGPLGVGWTERPQPGPPERGWRGLGNDGVNVLCTLASVGIAALLERMLS